MKPSKFFSFFCRRAFQLISDRQPPCFRIHFSLDRFRVWGCGGGGSHYIAAFPLDRLVENEKGVTLKAQAGSILM